MPSRRINPNLPEGQVSQGVTSPIRLSLPRAVNPSARDYDTGAIAEGLKFFQEKAAKRRQEDQETARLKAMQFVKDNPDVFAGASGEADIERALFNAAKDGSIPQGLLPQALRGAKQQTLYLRAETASINLNKWATGYDGVGENGEPKSLEQIQSEINSGFDTIFDQTVGGNFATDLDVQETYNKLRTSLESNWKQQAFTRALQDRENWQYGQTMRGFSKIADQISAPLSANEEHVVHQLFDARISEAQSFGVLNPENAMIDAAKEYAEKLSSEAGEEENVKHFLDTVLAYEWRGQSLEEGHPELSADLIDLRNKLERETPQTQENESRRLNNLDSLASRAENQAIAEIIEGLRSGKVSNAQGLERLDELYAEHGIDDEDLISISGRRRFEETMDSIRYGGAPDATLEQEAKDYVAGRSTPSRDRLDLFTLGNLSAETAARVEARRRLGFRVEAYRKETPGVDGKINEAKQSVHEQFATALSDGNLSPSRQRFLIQERERMKDEVEDRLLSSLGTVLGGDGPVEEVQDKWTSETKEYISSVSTNANSTVSSLAAIDEEFQRGYFLKTTQPLTRENLNSMAEGLQAAADTYLVDPRAARVLQDDLKRREADYTLASDAISEANIQRKLAPLIENFAQDDAEGQGLVAAITDVSRELRAEGDDLIARHSPNGLLDNRSLDNEIRSRLRAKVKESMQDLPAARRLDSLETLLAYKQGLANFRMLALQEDEAERVRNIMAFMDGPPSALKRRVVSAAGRGSVVTYFKRDARGSMSQLELDGYTPQDIVDTIGQFDLTYKDILAREYTFSSATPSLGDVLVVPSQREPKLARTIDLKGVEIDYAKTPLYKGTYSKFEREFYEELSELDRQRLTDFGGFNSQEDFLAAQAALEGIR